MYIATSKFYVTYKTQARFILSPDTEFSPKGSITQIEYLGDFNLYKRMLLTESANVESLFDWYNGLIFARSGSTQEARNAGRGDETEEDFQELIRAFTTIQVDDAPEIPSIVQQSTPPNSTASSNSKTTCDADNDTAAPRGSKRREALEEGAAAEPEPAPKNSRGGRQVRMRRK